MTTTVFDASQNTARLGLPLIQPGQALKYITHNEAIDRLDTLVQLGLQGLDFDTPPVNAEVGQVFATSDEPTGEWSGHPYCLARRTAFGWTFVPLTTGFTAISPDGVWTRWTGTAWSPVGSVEAAPHFGINTEADSFNRLSVKSDSVLFSHDDVSGGGSGDHRMVVNKSDSDRTASLLFQTAFSGRAELGVGAGDTVRLRSSSDGVTWRTHMEASPDEVGVTTDRLRSGTIIIGDDDMVALPTPAPGGLVAVTVVDLGGFPQPAFSALLAYDSGPSPQLISLAKLSGIGLLTSVALTGQTGHDGKTNMSAHDGHLEIENRTGALRTYSYLFLC